MEIVVTSIVAFTSTNIDDIFLLTLFYANKTLKGKEILVGQFLGIGALIAISLVGSLVGLLIDPAYVGLLGLLPIYLGVKALWSLVRNADDKEDDADGTLRKNRNSVLAIAGVTMANGGDNIGIYIPLFATQTWTEKVTMIVIFLLMTILWCVIARYFARHPYVARSVDKYGHSVTPLVLVLLGIYIMYESGTFGLIIK